MLIDVHSLPPVGRLVMFNGDATNIAANIQQAFMSKIAGQQIVPRILASPSQALYLKLPSPAPANLPMRYMGMGVCVCVCTSVGQCFCFGGCLTCRMRR
jgi:hypothetical protein